MKLLLDSFWRAAAYCLHPKVILLSLLPLVLAAGLTVGLGHLYWQPVIDWTSGLLGQWALLTTVLAWLESTLSVSLQALVAPFVVVAIVVPAVVLLSLVLVAVLMTPAIVNLVSARRFATLERRHGAPMWMSVAWSLGCTALAMAVLVLSVPLWLIPPLVLVLPPLIWGWLTYRVMTFDVLAEHADGDERRRLMREHRWPLLSIGIVTGYLGAAPTLVWALGALTLVFAPLLVVVSIWLYTLVFAFASLWFAHYALAALARLRGQQVLIDDARPAVPAVQPPPAVPAAGELHAPLPPPLPREPLA